MALFSVTIENSEEALKVPGRGSQLIADWLKSYESLLGTRPGREIEELVTYTLTISRLEEGLRLELQKAGIPFSEAWEIGSRASLDYIWSQTPRLIEVYEPDPGKAGTYTIKVIRENSGTAHCHMVRISPDRA